MERYHPVKARSMLPTHVSEDTGAPEHQRQAPATTWLFLCPQSTTTTRTTSILMRKWPTSLLGLPTCQHSSRPWPGSSTQDILPYACHATACQPMPAMITYAPCESSMAISRTHASAHARSESWQVCHISPPRMSPSSTLEYLLQRPTPLEGKVIPPACLEVLSSAL